MENKKSNTSVLVICLVAVILIVVTGILAYNYGNKNTKCNVKIEEKKEETEQDITNKAYIELFEKKIGMIESTSLKDTKEDSKIYTVYSKDTVGLENIDTSSLYFSVFSYYDNLFTEVTNKKLANSYDEVAPAKGLLQEVKKIYGDIDEPAEVIQGCPSYKIDKANNKIYMALRCGYGPEPYVISYIDKITEYDKSTYVYIYVGSVELDDDNGTNIIYSDPNLVNKYKTQGEKISLDFTDKDYKNFTQYKYTFIKNSDGYYIFSKLEKVK